MANLPNLNFVPCLDTVDENPVQIPNAASDLRTPTAQPAFTVINSGSSVPTGVQRWPVGA